MKFLGKTILTIALSLLALAAYSQVSIGPRVGINLASWSVDDVIKEDLGDPGTRMSYLFGAVAEIRLNDNFAIQPELTFIQKGAKFEATETDPVLGDATFEFNVVTNNIEIPVLLKAGTSFGAGRIDVLAGPSFAYGLNGKYKSKVTFNGQSEEEEEDIDYDDDEFSRTDLNLQFGAAFSFNVGGASVFVDGRYLLGLTNLNTGDDESGSVKNKGIALSVGALFPL